MKNRSGKSGQPSGAEQNGGRRADPRVSRTLGDRIARKWLPGVWLRGYQERALDGPDLPEAHFARALTALTTDFEVANLDTASPQYEVSAAEHPGIEGGVAQQVRWRTMTVGLPGFEGEGVTLTHRLARILNNPLDSDYRLGYVDLDRVTSIMTDGRTVDTLRLALASRRAGESTVSRQDVFTLTSPGERRPFGPWQHAQHELSAAGSYEAVPSGVPVDAQALTGLLHRVQPARAVMSS
jgi:hypothetical protein